MYYKISPILIILLIIVIIIIGFVGVKLVTQTDSLYSNSTDVEVINESIPSLELSISSDEENQESVTITAVATTDDEAGIHSITLPDGVVIRGDIVTYTAVENGNYTFKARGNNGKASTLTFEVKNIREVSANHPYIPTGFSYLGGEVNSGYVIQDEYGNQYVWIPVPTGKLTRNTLLDTNYEESNNTATALVNSVAKNYGFYVARFETAEYSLNGTTVAATMGGRTPWTNINYLDASSYAIDSAYRFGYDGYQTSIMNSYAWDTILAWIDQSFENYSTNTGYGNYSGNVRNTGATESDVKNNICDLAGNVREWTTEIYKKAAKEERNNDNFNNTVSSETVNYRVIRGGSANLSRTASSHSGYKENSVDNYWGFRMILYK